MITLRNYSCLITITMNFGKQSAWANCEPTFEMASVRMQSAVISRRPGTGSLPWLQQCKGGNKG